MSALTLMTTESVSVLSPSLTVRINVRFTLLSRLSDMLNAAAALSAFSSVTVTASPCCCCH